MADVEMGHGGLGEACGWFVLILYYNGREENAMRVSTLFPMADTLGVVILVALIALFADVIAQHVGPHDGRSRVRLGVLDKVIGYLVLLPVGLALEASGNFTDHLWPWPKRFFGDHQL